MKLLKFKLLLFLLTTTTFLQAQTVTQVQWWFDNDYTHPVTESASGSNFVWRKDMPTSSLQPGFHWLNLRFKDNAGNWSGATSHCFLKLDGVHGNVISDFEYWFGDDKAKIRNIPLSTVDLAANSEIGIILTLPMDTVPNGLHQLNFRVGYVNGFRSAISTTFFYKCDNVISEGNTVFEYWMDDNFEERKQQTFATLGGMSPINLDFSGLKEEGWHRLSYRIGNQGESFGPISSHYFFNNRRGANVLEWTFDDNPTVHSRPLNGSQENVVFDLPTGNLPKGVHQVHFRTGHQNGSYSTPTTDWFVKGANSYASAPREQQKITGYMYWFDSPESDVSQDITPTTYYSFKQNIEMPENLSKGNHLFYIKFKDNFGKWGDLSIDTFKNTTGRITTAKIKNLEPNANPFTYRIKRLATIYRYYRIFDELDNPIEGAVITYTVGNKEFKSEPSNSEGYVTIVFKTWGNDVNTEKDDDVEEGNSANNRMFFTGLWTDASKTTEIKVTENDFNFANLIVSDYQADEREYSLEVEGKFKANVPEASWADRLVSISDKAKVSFILKYEDGWTGKRQLTTQKYAFQNTFSASSGEKLKTPTPVLSASVSLENGAVHKYKMESEFSSSFRTAYDLLYSLLETTEKTDTKLFAIVKAIGHYLEDPPEVKEEESLGVFTSGNLAVGLGISIGGIPNEVSPVNVKLEAKWGRKGTYEFGNTSTRIGIFGRPHTYSDFLKNDIKKSFDVSGSIDFGDYAAVDGLHFGVGVNSAETGGMKIERKMNASYIPIEGSITTTQSSEYDVSVEFTTAALPWLPAFHVKAGKEYSSKYTLNKEILNNQMYFPINDPLWNYLNNKTNKVSLGSADEIMPNIENIYNGLKSQNPQFYDIVNNNFSLNRTKKYTAGVGVSKKIGLDVSFIGLDWSFEASAYALMEAKYPLGDFYYHPTTNKMYPQVTYADIDKPHYWVSPTQIFDDIWESCKKAILSRSVQIALKVKEFMNDAIVWMSGNDEVLSNASMPRQYANSLKNYSILRASTQTNKSIIEFHIPGNGQAFNNDTEVKLEWFYPGGELLGKTANQDTMIVISDLFFLRACHKWDTLSVAPLGNFKIYATVGDDDLVFLDIDSSYPASVYYQSLEDSTSTWHLIGSADNMIEYNKLGMYCLGIGVSDDKEPPVVSISKEENANQVEITITDNMAVYWKSVFVLINGIAIEWERIGSKIFVDLSEEQLQQDIYVTVYASDLARNEAQATTVFEVSGLSGSPTAITQSACKLYPNPALDICYLWVPNELQDEKTAYAIVNPSGKIFHREQIKNEETVINVSYLPAGVYFMVVFNDNRIITNQKLLKK